MALPSTIYRATIQLSHIDRNRYESLQTTIAQHPSETAERLVARLLAYAKKLGIEQVDHAQRAAAASHSTRSKGNSRMEKRAMKISPPPRYSEEYASPAAGRDAERGDTETWN